MILGENAKIKKFDFLFIFILKIKKLLKKAFRRLSHIVYQN